MVVSDLGGRRVPPLRDGGYFIRARVVCRACRYSTAKLTAVSLSFVPPAGLLGSPAKA
jgi:hypothetical protein